ncbi:MAG: YbjN domain-containing protein [Pseudomonadota bacterium]
MSELFQTVLDSFLEKGWPVRQHQSLPVLQMAYETDNGVWDCYVQVEDQRKQVLAYSVLPERVPEARRAAMAEFLTRANFGLVIGNFELDFADGELRYKAGLDVGQDELSVEQVNALVKAVLDAMDDHLPGIRQVQQGSATPEAALQAVHRTLASTDFHF